MYERSDVQQYLASRVARPSSAGVILENIQGEALVLKANYKSYWSFPGGWAEDEQTPPEAAVRELIEECGIVRAVEDLDFIRVINRKSDIMQTYQFIFRARTPYNESEVLKLQPEEIDASKFVSKKSVRDTPSAYGWAVVLWAQDDPRGYAEQRLES